MLSFRRNLFLGAALLLAFGGRPIVVAAERQAGIAFVKYPQMGDLIKKQRGKIVIVDFWNIG